MPSFEADGLGDRHARIQSWLSGSLKSVLDLLLKEYIHKAVAFVGVSAGPWGGTRVIESMVPMVRELGLAVTFSDLNFPASKLNSTTTATCSTMPTKNASRAFSTSLFGWRQLFAGAAKTSLQNIIKPVGYNLNR